MFPWNNIFHEKNNVLEVWQEERQAAPTLLQSLPRSEHAGYAPDTLGATEEVKAQSQLPILRKRLPETREIGKKAVRALWIRTVAEAPRRLFQASARSMAV